MNTKKYCVYSHTNKINNKIYIGLTSMISEERWKNGMGIILELTLGMRLISMVGIILNTKS